MQNIMPVTTYSNKTTSLIYSGSGSLTTSGTEADIYDGAYADTSTDSFYVGYQQNDGASASLTYTVTFSAAITILRLAVSYGSFWREIAGSCTQSLKVDGVAVHTGTANGSGIGSLQFDSSQIRYGVKEVKIELTSNSTGSDTNPRGAWCYVNELMIYTDDQESFFPLLSIMAS